MLPDVNDWNVSKTARRTSVVTRPPLKASDAEVYRLDRVGKVTSEQMAREGALITRHPLLIQKTMADKLSDKISVIIAPPSTNGDFIGAHLLGTTRNNRQPAAADGEEQVSTGGNKERQ